MYRINLDEIIKKLTKVRIGIIGDFCLDVYWNIDKKKSEVSIETGLMTKPVAFQKYSLGGAGNVASNLIAMKVGSVKCFGVIGNDPFGYKMRALMSEMNIDHNALIEQSDSWNTHVYIKPIEEGNELNRIDFGCNNSISEKSIVLLIEKLSNEINNIDALIINQQIAEGIHNSLKFQQSLQKLINKHPDKLFFLDSRNYAELYENTIRKINSYEALKLCSVPCEPDDIVAEKDTVEAAKILQAKWNKPLFVTRGARGCIIFDGKNLDIVPGLHITNKIDTVGAGDSMLSGIASAMAAGFNPLTAATFGNFVAGVTVQKLYQTGTASPDEIRKIGSEPDYIFQPEKADDIRSAIYYKDSEIEIVRKSLEIEKISHAIFDHDGTISVLREGWEKIMEPMMVKAILGPVFATADESAYHKVINRVRKFIDATTGVQTLVQMQGLVEIVKEFGYTPKNQILDEFGYKAIYNEALLELVRKRIDKLNKGELSIDDFIIKGVVPFLHTLVKSGIKLYMASGSDENDVIEEAKALGYADLFEGRIYGAIGDATKEAKKIVMDRIIKDIGTQNSRKIAAFGDGPVEIREINKRCGLAIGIASDEIRRFGLNHSKRSRLIRAGADIIIPDYSQSKTLCKILKIQG